MYKALREEKLLVYDALSEDKLLVYEALSEEKLLVYEALSEEKLLVFEALSEEYWQSRQRKRQTPAKASAASAWHTLQKSESS